MNRRKPGPSRPDPAGGRPRPGDRRRTPRDGAALPTARAAPTRRRRTTGHLGGRDPGPPRHRPGSPPLARLRGPVGRRGNQRRRDLPGQRWPGYHRAGDPGDLGPGDVVSWRERRGWGWSMVEPGWSGQPPGVDPALGGPGVLHGVQHSGAMATVVMVHGAATPCGVRPRSRRGGTPRWPTVWPGTG